MWNLIYKASFDNFVILDFPFISNPRISLISFVSWISDYPVYNSSIHLVTHRCLERLIRRPCARSTSKDTPNANDQFTSSRSTLRRGVNERNSKSSWYDGIKGFNASSCAPLNKEVHWRDLTTYYVGGNKRWPCNFVRHTKAQSSTPWHTLWEKERSIHGIARNLLLG